MYRIKFLPKTRKYRFEKNNGQIAMEGDIMQVSKFAMQQGLENSELTYAYKVMADNVHTIAEFGMRGTFMYSHNGRQDSLKSTEPTYH